MHNSSCTGAWGTLKNSPSLTGLSPSSDFSTPLWVPASHLRCSSFCLTWTHSHPATLTALLFLKSSRRPPPQPPHLPHPRTFARAAPSAWNARSPAPWPLPHLKRPVLTICPHITRSVARGPGSRSLSLLSDSSPRLVCVTAFCLPRHPPLQNFPASLALSSAGPPGPKSALQELSNVL